MANSANEMAKLLYPFTITWFSLTNDNSKKLQDQFCVYFNVAGITNESCLGMMTRNRSWSLVESFSTKKQDMNQLAVPVTLLLSKLATYTILLRKKSQHISSDVLLSDLATLYKKYYERKLKKKLNRLPLPLNATKIVILRNIKKLI